MLTVKEGLFAYAKMMNNLDSSEFENLISNDFQYESQMVLVPINGKQEFINYIRSKLGAIKNTNTRVFAEMAELNAYGQSDCVLIAQNDKNNFVATAYLKILEKKVVRLDICIFPDPKAAKRIGIYPK